MGRAGGRDHHRERRDTIVQTLRQLGTPAHPLMIAAHADITAQAVTMCAKRFPAYFEIKNGTIWLHPDLTR